MIAQCLIVLAVGLVDSGGDALADVGQVKWDFAVPCRWELVLGWKGNAKVSKASAVFSLPNEVQIDCEVKTENGSFGYWSTRTYNLERHSGLPVFPGPCSDPLTSHLLGLAPPSLRMMGNHMELTIPECPLLDSNRYLPPGTLHLILKRVP
jgi:hypothetical protein